MRYASYKFIKIHGKGVRELTIYELSNEFLNKYAKRRLRPNTIRGYRTNLEKHILPIIGSEDIEKINVEILDEITDRLQEKGLTNKSILYVHATLRKMLNYGNKRDLFYNGSYEKFDLPRIEGYKHTVLNEKEIIEVLKIANGTTEIELAIRLAIKYGMRRGEILGLQQEDLDAVNCVLHIQRTRSFECGKEIITPCKTKSSNRYVLIQEKDAKDLEKCDGKWLIPLTPTQIDKRFKKFLQIYGFKNVRFHDLRHSYATLMLAKGVNPKIVSTVLGHSGIQVTLNIYSHPDVSMQKACLDVIPMPF